MVQFATLIKPWGILKLLQLITAIVCIALLRHFDLHFGGEPGMASFRDRYLVGVICIGGMILVTLPILVSYLFGASEHYRPALEMIYSVVGFALFLTSGALCLEFYHRYSDKPGNVHAGKALGSMLVINGAFYLIDAIVAYKNVYDK